MLVAQGLGQTSEVDLQAQLKHVLIGRADEELNAEAVRADLATLHAEVCDVISARRTGVKSPTATQPELFVLLETTLLLHALGDSGAPGIARFVAELDSAYGAKQETTLHYQYLAAAMNYVHECGHPRAAALMSVAAADLLPFDAIRGTEALRIGTRIAAAAGRWDVCKTLLARLDRYAETSTSSGEDSAVTEARATAKLAFGEYYNDVGLIDLAKQYLFEAEELSRADGTVNPLVLLGIADLLTSAESFTQYLALLKSWRESDPWLFEPSNAANLGADYALSLNAAICESELARQGEGSIDQAEAQFLALAEQPDPQGDVATFLWIRACLADIALRKGDPGRAGSFLQAARKALSGLDPYSRLDLESELLAMEVRQALTQGASEERFAALQLQVQDILRAQFASWKRVQRVDGAVGFLFHSQRRRVLSAAVELELRKGGADAAERALSWLLQAQMMGSLASKMGLKQAPTLSEIRQEYIVKGHAVVLLLPGKDDGESHVFAIDAAGLAHTHARSRDALRKPAEAIDAQLSSLSGRVITDSSRERLAEGLRRHARALGECIFPGDSEVRGILARNESLTIVGSDLIGGAPADVWVVFDGVPLGETHALSSMESLPVAMAILRRRATDFRFDYGLIAGLQVSTAWRSHQGLVDYDLSPQELVDWTGPFRGKVWQVSPSEVSFSALRARSGDMAQTAVVHFLVHGTYLRDRERGAALLLSARGSENTELLTCEALEADLSFAGLVIFSSCGTGLGPSRHGDDRSADLAGAALHAGARVVLSNRYIVELGDARDLIGHLQLEIAQGASPAAALRRARALRSAKNDVLTQMLDARFTLQGVGHLPILQH